MRGRLLDGVIPAHRFRNTPAYAGKTKLVVPGKPRYGKHPRVCGEDFSPDVAISNNTETPPRMRGRRAVLNLGTALWRNTPAYAGKTCAAASGVYAFEKHPRVCGEDKTL